MSRPLHLLMTTDAVGGVWRYALDLAAALAPHRVVTTLAVLGPAPDKRERLAAKAIPGLRLVETGLPLDWVARDASEVLAAGEALQALAEGVRPDLLQLNMPSLGAGAEFGAPVIAVTHGCVATWWDAVEGTPMPSDLEWRAALHQEGLRAADIAVAPSNAFARATARVYALQQLPRAVYNGRASATQLRRPAGSATFAFTACRLWDRGKNTAVLDRAAAAMKVPLRAAGATLGPHGESIETRHLELLGHLSSEAVTALLAERPIYVSPAVYEPFGLAVLEAARAGCALVLADTPTFRELWDDAAVFVAADDAEALARSADALAEDAVKRADLGRRARARARRFTPAATAEGMLGLYRTLLDKAAPVPELAA